MISRCSAGWGATPVLSIAVILLMVDLSRADDGTDDAEAQALLASWTPEAAALDAMLSTVQKYRQESVQTIHKWDSGVGHFSQVELVFDVVYRGGVNLETVKATLRHIAARLPIEVQDRLLDDFLSADEEGRVSPGGNFSSSDLWIPSLGGSVQSASMSFTGTQGLNHGFYLQIVYNSESKDYTIASFMHSTSFALAPNQILITKEKNMVSSLQKVIAASVSRDLERRALGAAAPNQQPASQVPQSSAGTEL